MKKSIFDDESILFFVLVNDQRQYSLWPQALAIPKGWHCVQGPMSRDECSHWLTLNWTDLCPISTKKEQPIS